MASAQSSTQSPDALPSKQPFLSPQISSYFIAGGLAGAASRTVVSPLERLKIIQQVQPATAEGQYKGVWASLMRMWREEGFRGYMRGNGINCLRIVPYSAVQFTTYEQLKKWFTNYGETALDTPTRLAAGALAGITSVCSTYPLDLVRSRLSIATASIPLQASPAPAQPTLTSAYHTASASASVSGSLRRAATNTRDLTVWGMTQKVIREEGGVRALYRGIVATAVGVAPYVGINFAAYEALRGAITPPGKSSVPRKLLCGALAGSISQTLTYPFDVLRRKMQVVGMGALGVRYTGAFDALIGILRTEGPRGLYRGLWPNLLKVAPSIATSFFTYELVKELLGAS
ncbi:mitochondrial carrier [Wolfiporia cocos MD-104 SS10]|uniref:Mitochondrial carrier n=1 Tax=Wolfiporia cocos (strain MD-104) TaxID=742152 RepID=A0A2H3K5L2_WOLCO|nr:mitochondrial carrier [Wolfiporia cocos MD-104 SS10]